MVGGGSDIGSGKFDGEWVGRIVGWWEEEW